MERRPTKPVPPGTPRPCTCSRFGPARNAAGDALGLVIYRGRDMADAEVFHLQSHFVLRRTADVWLDGKRLTLPAGTASKDGPNDDLRAVGVTSSRPQ